MGHGKERGHPQKLGLARKWTVPRVPQRDMTLLACVDTSPPELQDNTDLLFKPLRVRQFVTAALRNQYN